MKTVGAYFIVYVADMDRALAFYRDVFDGDVTFESPHWSSLVIAGANVGLHPRDESDGPQFGLGFDCDDLDAACAAVENAGGKVVTAPEHREMERITIATVADTEGNDITLTLPGNT
jgi:predicted enzyme related to lactoylglutathione lyase